VVAPLAVAVSASGHMYVADSDGRVIELNPGGRAVRVWGPFGHPDGIAVDSRGTVFVADGGRNEIYVFSSPSGKLRGTIGAAAGLSRPEGLAIDCAGDLLVTDSLNNRIQIFHGAAAPGVC
jgi:DNA-binding beta-propeller fold protein YncE